MRKVHHIALICGDGIGKEVVPATQRVLSALNSKKYTFKYLDAGFEEFQRTGTALPAATLQALSLSSNAFSGALFGAVSSPSHKVKGYASPIVQMRRLLDLYANVRPVVHAGKNIDLLILRENTECLYVKQESESSSGTDIRNAQGQLVRGGGKTAVAKRVITEYASRRIGRLAGEMALKRSKTRQSPPKITIVHKANVLSVTDGLFRESVLDELKRDEKFSGIKVEEQLVDSMVYRLFREAHMFDVCVAPNMYGDIISDAAAALVGSLGLVPGANVGDSFVMGEPVHGSAPDIAGQDKANPIACIRSAALLLEYLGESDDASRINQAVEAVMARGTAELTPDVSKNGKGTCSSVTDAIIRQL